MKIWKECPIPVDYDKGESHWEHDTCSIFELWDDAATPVAEGAILIEGRENEIELMKLIRLMTLLEVVPWVAAQSFTDTAEAMARRVAIRVLAELKNPGDGYNGDVIRRMLASEVTRIALEAGLDD